MRRAAVIITIIFLGLSAILYFDMPSVLDEEAPQPIPDSILFNNAPVLSPQQALQTFEIQEGFRIELVASEPLIQKPVAMTFDAKGRIWVVEMQSFMPNVKGTGEEQASSRIVILEDRDGDGRMDNSKIFLDGLVMPRAIAVVGDGILYAEPPNLWFVKNNNDKPGQKILVDSAYAVGGNVEHQANGLTRGIDNWYYNAKSRKRYRYQDKQWVIEETEFRGQWGITKDNRGRLFYNTNSNQLRGDLVPPNLLNRNPHFKPSLGTNVEIASNQNVYPIRPTPGINRGYLENMLDEELKLKQFTAACGPLIYRGDQFPVAFVGNAFVCEPAGNLIKRNILKDNGLNIEARHAYENEEFLASKDERFRPVNLYNGPDGNMYLLDMYSGIIQHKTYLTDYLENQIKSRDLEKPLDLGRIYRIVYEGKLENNRAKSENKPDLDQATDKALLAYLSHPNGWWRDNAQRLLVERNNRAIVPDLIDLLRQDYENYNQLHALWTLEGLGVYNPDIIQLGMKAKAPEVVAATIQVGSRNKDSVEARAILDIYAANISRKEPLVQLHLALSLGEFMKADSTKVMRLLKTISLQNEADALFREAIASSLTGKEQPFLTLSNQNPEADPAMIAFLEEILASKRLKEQLKESALTESEKEQYILGKTLFENTCEGCHGENGEGIVPIAPPLAGSEWVMGQEKRLILIALHGLQGPVTVKGKVYKTPEVQPVMPGIKGNPEFTDEKLANLLTYIRNAWGNKATAVAGETVSTIRKKSKDRREPFTEEELLE